MIGGITLYRTFALYEEKKEFNILRGKVPTFSQGDIELAVFIDGEKTNTFPTKESDYLVENIECDNEAIGTWDYNAWGILVSNLTTSKTTCTLSFKGDMIAKLKSIINSTSSATTVDTLLANNDDINKIVANETAMNFIIDNSILKNAIKSSKNYTIEIAKKILNSTVVSELKKYNAELPCYL